MFDRGLLVSFTQKLYLELKSNIYPLLQRRPSKIIAPLSGFHWFLTSGQGLHAHEGGEKLVGVVGFVKKPLLCAKEDINKKSTTTEEVQTSVYFFPG